MAEVRCKEHLKELAHMLKSLVALSTRLDILCGAIAMSLNEEEINGSIDSTLPVDNS